MTLFLRPFPLGNFSRLFSTNSSKTANSIARLYVGCRKSHKNKHRLNRLKALIPIQFAPQQSALLPTTTDIQPTEEEPHGPMFVLGLHQKPLFPGYYQILQVEDPEVLQFLMDLKSCSGTVGGFLLKKLDSSSDDLMNTHTFRKEAGRVSNLEEIHETGTSLFILNVLPNVILGGKGFSSVTSKPNDSGEEDKMLHNQKVETYSDEETAKVTGGQVIVLPQKRIRIKGLAQVQLESSPLLNVDVSVLARTSTDQSTTVQRALHVEVVSSMKALLKTSYVFKDYIDHAMKYLNLDNPHSVMDLIGNVSCIAGRDELQAMLVENDAEKRLCMVLSFVKKDLDLAKLQGQLKAQVEEKMSQEQKKYLLNEQMKAIKKELGIAKDDDKDSLLKKFRTIAEEKRGAMPIEAAEAMDYEISRLSLMEPSSSEYTMCRSYLECLTGLPYGTSTVDNSDLSLAEKILAADHYGLKEVKDRVLEFIAVNTLKGEVHGKILCLVGPPGVGKTSIGASIARALNRKFFRFSLGGLSDVAELRGHRRTYVGAMPGKFVQALKQTQSINPLILLDELDKIGRETRGDPTSALLEVLDPNQNSSFRDHYLDLPVDLSKVLFLCTANSAEQIPAPLLDRLEILRLAGYVLEEKLCILNQYIIPQTRKATGIVDHNRVSVSDDALLVLLKNYAREAGVRQLVKYIEKIYRKAAVKMVRDPECSDVVVNANNLTDFVGQAVYPSERLYEKNAPPGVVVGLAWTQNGGATLYIEVVGRSNGFKNDTSVSNEDNSNKASSNNSALKVTGQLGSVMNESTQIAFTFARKYIKSIDANNNYLDNHDLHIHIPEGATPKDGPSAGITLTTAILSLGLNTPINEKIAMTGELTLTGKVLKVGGIKEKVIAAKRDGFTTLIFPAANKADFEELEDYIRNGLTVHYAQTYVDVYKIIFQESEISKNLPSISASKFLDGNYQTTTTT